MTSQQHRRSTAPTSDERLGRIFGELPVFASDVRFANGKLDGDPDVYAVLGEGAECPYIVDGGQFAFPGRTPFTFLLCFRARGHRSNHQRLLARTVRSDEEVHGWEVVLTTTNAISFNRYAGRAVDHLVTDRVVDDERWSTLVGRFDGAALSVSVSGAPTVREVATVELSDVEAVTIVGGASLATRATTAFRGDVSVVAIAEGVLSDQEIQGFLRPGLRRAAPRRAEEAIERLWRATVGELLATELWSCRDAFDAGQHLMVGSYASVLCGQEEWLGAIDDHGARFARAVRSESVVWADQESMFQYLLVFSRFLALRRLDTRSMDSAAEALTEMMLDAVRKQWVDAQGTLEAILDRASTGTRPERASRESTLLMLGVAADLRGLGVRDEVLDDALEHAVRLCASEIRWTADGGWLWQPGVAPGDPEFAFIGCAESRDEVNPAPLHDVAQDSWHAHHWPVLLDSLRWGAFDSEPRQRFFTHLADGLGRQLVTKVIVPGSEAFPAPRATNFMDGSNGVYNFRSGRAEPGGRGAEASCGPYQLSGTLTLGWWSVLGRRRIGDLYDQLLAAFPLAAAALDTYVGTPQSRQRNPMFDERISLRAGTREVIVRQAALVAELIDAYREQDDPAT